MCFMRELGELAGLGSLHIPSPHPIDHAAGGDPPTLFYPPAPVTVTLLTHRALRVTPTKVCGRDGVMWLEAHAIQGTVQRALPRSLTRT